MNSKRFYLRLFTAVIFAAIIAGFVLPLLGQTNDPSLPDATDVKVKAAFDKYSALKLFIMPVVTVLVMGLRRVITKIPDQIWPWVCPFLGVGIDYLASKTGLWSGSMEAGAAMGGLATWLHQLGTQTKTMAEGNSTTKFADDSPTPARTKLPLLMLCGVLAFQTAVFTGPLLLTGCATQVAEGSDPVVVSAEQDIKTAYHLADAFVTWEFLNRASAGKDATEAADRVRRGFRQWNATATGLVRTYKANRTPENKANLLTIQALLQQVMAEITHYLPTDKVAAAKAKAVGK